MISAILMAVAMAARGVALGAVPDEKPTVRPAATTQAVEVTVTLAVPAKARVISPFIYGTNFDIGHPERITFMRMGGNRITAYNWENNASNAGSDWHHQSDDFMGKSDVAGWAIEQFVGPVLGRGQVALVTVPMAGYVAADKLGNGDVNQTPDFLNKRFKKSVASKSKAGAGPFVYPPDVNDDFVYQDEMVHWLEGKYPAQKRNGGDIWYALDNEPDIWDSTHARLRTKKLTYAELIERTVEWSSAIKAVAPKALVFGFVSYGYGGYSTLNGATDGKGRFFIDFFLSEMAAAEKSAGKRLVDVLDLHWYPETYGGGKRITDASSAPEVAAARIQAPRHLYDPKFRENSWIDRDATHGPIYLLPTLNAKIEKNYPGTKLAFTEYNYGGGGDISGAIAEADVLGAFGRYGVFAAAYWPESDDKSYISAGFDAYRNYDGNGGKFGDQSLDAATSDIEHVSAWASTDKAGKLTVVLINRGAGPATVTLKGAPVAGYAHGQLFILSAGNPVFKPAGQADLAKRVTLPGMSVTVLAGGK